jgi:hypothetical protein
MKFVILLMIVLFLANNVHGQDTLKGKYLSVILDSSKGKDALNQCSRTVPNNVTGFWVMTESDKKNLEAKLPELKQNVGSLSLDDYAYQYVGLIIGKQKFIYINAFYKDLLKLDIDIVNWKNAIVMACDGGDHFWGAVYEVNKMQFSNIAFNGGVRYKDN